jgi:hypothetical protein
VDEPGRYSFSILNDLGKIYKDFYNKKTITESTGGQNSATQNIGDNTISSTTGGAGATHGYFGGITYSNEPGSLGTTTTKTITETGINHIFIVRKDLGAIRHLFPSFDKPKGVFSLNDLEFPTEGLYRFIFSFSAPKDDESKKIGQVAFKDIAIGDLCDYGYSHFRFDQPRFFISGNHDHYPSLNDIFLLVYFCFQPF